MRWQRRRLVRPAVIAFAFIAAWAAFRWSTEPVTGSPSALATPPAVQPTTAGASVDPTATAPATVPTSPSAVPTTASASSGPTAVPPEPAHSSATARPGRPATAPPGPASTGTGSSGAGASGTAASGSGSGTGRIQYGRTYSGDGTFYGATGAGNCSYDAGPDRMIVAMNRADYDNSQACGAYLAVTGPTGTRITVKVVDQCPECRPGDLDLSAEAFAKLASPSAGRIRVSWSLLSPTVSGPVSYVYKSGSSQYWCAIQVRNHRNPVRSLEVRVGGGWRSLPRQSYNYFLSADGAGCGSQLRITDIYGGQLIDSGISVRPDAVQSGAGQFGLPG
ncbi:MAG TPA: expansin EXLX1 family cellulose-binding protein [Kineosporiaceae bacterium]|nr:expansin EXLX1 family cellulose-binding protein [Kineosporiaceae bacterium]